MVESDWILSDKNDFLICELKSSSSRLIECVCGGGEGGGGTCNGVNRGHLSIYCLHVHVLAIWVLQPLISIHRKILISHWPIHVIQRLQTNDAIAQPFQPLQPHTDVLGRATYSMYVYSDWPKHKRTHGYTQSKPLFTWSRDFNYEVFFILWQITIMVFMGEMSIPISWTDDICSSLCICMNFLANLSPISR